MKSKLCLHLGALAAPLLAVALYAAAPAETKPETPEEKKARVARENLAKYDENKDGRLDRVETAVMRLDQARAAAAAAAAKKKAAEEKKMSAAQRRKKK